MGMPAANKEAARGGEPNPAEPLHAKPAADELLAEAQRASLGSIISENGPAGWWEGAGPLPRWRKPCVA
jgi:hypothetical protein